MSEYFIHILRLQTGQDATWQRPKINGTWDIQSPRGNYELDFSDNFKDCAFAYLQEDNYHYFMCTKKTAEIYGCSQVELCAKLESDEVLSYFNKRIAVQLRLPDWFMTLESEREKVRFIAENISDFSKWVDQQDDDAWQPSNFPRPLLAKIVDDLLSAIKNNKRAKIVLICNEETLGRAQELLFKALRCLPVNLANRLTFNTAAKEIVPFDICCGKFSTAEVQKCGGVRIDLEKALSNQSVVSESELFHNPYADYIQMLSGDKDPCERFYNEDNVDTLNTLVNNEVLEVMVNKLTVKCKKGEVTVKELCDFADRAKGCDVLDKKQLHKIADYLCLNYIGFTRCYFHLADEYQSFYLSFVTDKGKCPGWNIDENIELLFSQNDEQGCNKEFIKMLYYIWQGEGQNTVYKTNNTISEFLFSDYDIRFRDNNSLHKAFKEYWDSLGENDLIEYLIHYDALSKKVVIDYIINRNGKTIEKFIEYCCDLKTNKGIDTNIVNKIFNRYLLNWLKNGSEKSVEVLESMSTITDKNGFILDSNISSEIQHQINIKNTNNSVQVINCLVEYNNAKVFGETKKRDIKIAKSWQKSTKKECNLDDDVVVYNIARLSERDCGMAGIIHNANKFGKLKSLELFTVILFFLQSIVLGLADFFLLNRLYIFGWQFWAQIVITGIMFLVGVFLWLHLYIKIHSEYMSEQSHKPECDNKQYKSESVKILKSLFRVCVCATCIKVCFAIICITVL